MERTQNSEINHDFGSEVKVKLELEAENILNRDRSVVEVAGGAYGCGQFEEVKIEYTDSSEGEEVKEELEDPLFIPATSESLHQQRQNTINSNCPRKWTCPRCPETLFPTIPERNYHFYSLHYVDPNPNNKDGNKIYRKGGVISKIIRNERDNLRRKRGRRKESEEKKEQRRARDRISRREKRLNMTKEEWEEFKERNRISQRERRLKKTKEELEELREKDRISKRERRSEMSKEKLEEIREKNKIRTSENRLKMTKEKLEELKEKGRIRKRNQRLNCTDEGEKMNQTKIESFPKEELGKNGKMKQKSAETFISLTCEFCKTNFTTLYQLERHLKTCPSSDEDDS